MIGSVGKIPPTPSASFESCSLSSVEKYTAVVWTSVSTMLSVSSSATVFAVTPITP
ncbi:hypothetical protein ACOJBM_16710 [Rhizobium beringeri]